MSTMLEKKPATDRMPAARNPFALMDRMRDEMDRLFDGFGLKPLTPGMSRLAAEWMPAIEVERKPDLLHVRADLPGLKREDVKVEVTPEGVTLSGERRHETKEEKKDDGFFRTERFYGSFCRFVPLPDGAEIDKATAAFKDGVLEVNVPVQAAEKPAGRTLEIG
jgi:HSP20 family protein